MVKSIAPLACLVLIAAILSGCGFAGEPKPDTDAGIGGIVVRGEILVSEDVNPDQDGHPAPVRLRIYRLQSHHHFKNADFPSLHDDDERVLATDLIFKEEMTVYPGNRIPFHRAWGPNARYLGVMAIFGTGENAEWRALTDVSRAGGSEAVIVRLQDSSVSLWRRVDGMGSSG
uniref:Type VI secretion system protein VasD n=1 Tax=Candidatus Kentrum eta TaxID=2126337 RepID=A0A450UI95_9GAMM|nr:MAG: type VI secretion system protein VasD [Candidatus Kentron sp. H]VFJ93198.1 MAG: type VI secretion system protein VasD [Candidatus Kentron sp. H]VFK00036.1 MAG: type VI secretion system protein VasD [Candidatus Kentron sp. H]